MLAGKQHGGRRAGAGRRPGPPTKVVHLPVPLADFARKLAVDLPPEKWTLGYTDFALPVPVLLSTPFVLPILLNLAERAIHYLSPLPVFSVTAPLVPDGNWGTRNSSHNNIRARPL